MGAVFLLIACTFFLFSVYDIAQGWRDRAKLQQTVDAAALSSGAFVCDLLTIMELYNKLSLIKYLDPVEFLAVGEAIDTLRCIAESVEIIGPLTGLIGSDTHYPLLAERCPDLGTSFDRATCKFIIKRGQEPGNRVIKIRGFASTISSRYVLKKYLPKKHVLDETVITTCAEVGVYSQRGLITTYVPVLLH